MSRVEHGGLVKDARRERAGGLARFRTHKSPADMDRALRFIVRTAAHEVPHYRDLFKGAELKASDIGTISSLVRVPITPRRCLAEKPYTDFLRERSHLADLYASHTSGSTGTPATILLSRVERAYRRWLLFRAIQARFPRFFPVRITDVGQMTTQKLSHLTQRMGPIRLTRIPGDIPMADQVTSYLRSKPQLLEGYAGSLELLAQQLRGLASYPRPRCIISRGETLPSSGRWLLQEVFGCPVANFYNSEEVGNIAWECRDHPNILHVNTDACYLELLDERGAAVAPGIEGRVIMTNLYNRTMPFIRYDTGDWASWDIPSIHPCSCGARTPTLASIEGRTDDFLVLPDGRRVSPLVVLTAVLNGTARATAEGAYVGQVLQFQVVQEDTQMWTVRIVPGASPPSDLEQPLTTELRRLHPDLQIRISLEKEIPLEPTGKLKRIVCRLRQSP